MTTKADWPERDRPPRDLHLPAPAEAVIARSARLTRQDVVRLDIADRDRPALVLTAWDQVRDGLDRAGLRYRRYAARDRAWAAVNDSLRALALEPVADDDYWRVATRVGAGAARAARFAACAWVCPEILDPELVAVLTAPWRAVIREDEPDRAPDDRPAAGG